MPRIRLPLACLLSSLLALAWAATAGAQARPAPQAAGRPEGFDKKLFAGLEWRSIGPFRGGRSVAVAGVPSQPFTFYFGGTGGGVFKTTDGGINWTPVTDGQLATGTVGAIAVAESDPTVIYVGMGEACIRGYVSQPLRGYPILALRWLRETTERLRL